MKQPKTKTSTETCANCGRDKLIHTEWNFDTVICKKFVPQSPSRSEEVKTLDGGNTQSIFDCSDFFGCAWCNKKHLCYEHMLIKKERQRIKAEVEKVLDDFSKEFNDQNRKSIVLYIKKRLGI